MNKKLLGIINKITRGIGFQLNRYPTSDLKRRIKLIKHFEINKTLDVGANEGQYALQLRRLGFDGKIVSFEPYSKAFIKLKEKTEKDKNWIAYNLALGNRDEEEFLNISYNSVSSSFLDMLPIHLKSEPMSRYISKEKVKIRKLDSIFHKFFQEGDRIFLKIDTQGFEQKVLEGAKESLHLIKGIQIEMSISPLYRGEMQFVDLLNFITERGFLLYSLETGFHNPETGQLLQVDGIFFK